MNHSGDAAEQIVRLSLEGFELAAKITGEGVKNIAILLHSILKEEKKTKGKSRLSNMLRSGKELKVFALKNEDMKKFSQEAKRYGVLFCVLRDKENKTPSAIVDVIARAEDAAKINRIVERFSLSSVDKATIINEAKKSIDLKKDFNGEKDNLNLQKDEADILLDDVLIKSTANDKNSQNPQLAKTEKNPLSEPLLKQPKKIVEGTVGNEKPSVRQQLRKIKLSRMEQEKTANIVDEKPKNNNNNRQTFHKQPNNKKKKDKRIER